MKTRHRYIILTLGILLVWFFRGFANANSELYPTNQFYIIFSFGAGLVFFSSMVTGSYGWACLLLGWVATDLAHPTVFSENFYQLLPDQLNFIFSFARIFFLCYAAYLFVNQKKFIWLARALSIPTLSLAAYGAWMPYIAI